MIVYDVEIKKAVPDRKLPNIDGIEYCAGWDDYTNMGIAVVCTCDTQKQKYGVYCDDNQVDFLDMINRQKSNGQLFVSYNGVAFDNRVLAACWGINLDLALCYDVLVEIWQAHGLGPAFQYPSHSGFSLDDVCACNSLGAKSMHGSMAPVLWQRGEIGKVINYCLEDVTLTSRLLRRAVEGKFLLSPKTGKEFVLRNPMTVAGGK